MTDAVPAADLCPVLPDALVDDVASAVRCTCVETRRIYANTHATYCARSVGRGELRAVLEAAAPHITAAERQRLAVTIRELYGKPTGDMIANALESGQL